MDDDTIDFEESEWEDMPEDFDPDSYDDFDFNEDAFLDSYVEDRLSGHDGFDF